MKDINELDETLLSILEKPEIECSDVSELMGEYVDRDLPPGLRFRVYDHICSCDHCKKFEKSYRLVVDLAHELKHRPVAREVKNRLRQVLNARLGLQLPEV